MEPESEEMGVTVVRSGVVRIDKNCMRNPKAGRWLVLDLSFDANFPSQETKENPLPNKTKQKPSLLF